MPAWLDKLLVFAVIAATVIFFIWRGCRRYKQNTQSCGGDCCASAKTTSRKTPLKPTTTA
jgi:ABC-type glucose/galactose transport system permease subunit